MKTGSSLQCRIPYVCVCWFGYKRLVEGNFSFIFTQESRIPPASPSRTPHVDHVSVCLWVCWRLERVPQLGSAFCCYVVVCVHFTLVWSFPGEGDLLWIYMKEREKITFFKIWKRKIYTIWFPIYFTIMVGPCMWVYILLKIYFAGANREHTPPWRYSLEWINYYKSEWYSLGDRNRSCWGAAATVPHAKSGCHSAVNCSLSLSLLFRYLSVWLLLPPRHDLLPH